MNTTYAEQAAPVPYHANLPSTEFRDDFAQWDAEEVHLRDYLEVVLRRKWLIISTLLLVFVSALIMTLSQTRLYKASASIEVMFQEQNVTKFEEVARSDLHTWEYFETQVKLLESREMIRRAIDGQGLADHPLIEEVVFQTEEPGPVARLKGAVRDVVRSLIPADRHAPTEQAPVDPAVRRREMLMGYLGGNLQVSSEEDSMLIGISFTSPDPRLSQLIVNAVAEEFVQWNMDKKLQSSDLARTFLMKQIDRAKIGLEKAEEELNGFAQQAGIVSLDSKHNSVFRQLEDLNVALAAAEAEMISRKAVYDQAIKDGPSVLPEVMESPMIGQLKAEYAKLQAEYEKQSVIFQDEYPAVRALLGRMNSIAKRIAEEERKIFATVRNRYEAAVQKKTGLEKRVAQQMLLAMDLNERTTQYKIMAREVETNKQIYESLLERSMEIESMTGITASNINIVDRADLPRYPVKPNVRRNLMLAMVLGMMAGLGLAFFLEYITDHIANPDEISDRFRIPILGVLPLVKKNRDKLDKALEVEPRAPFCEALRTTCVSLQLSGTGNKSRSFVVTSTRPEEGKTTVACNLALTFAAGGEKVVLVDADMRRPRIHKIFSDGVTVEGPLTGLSNFLAGESEQDPVRKNGFENLHFIPAGPIPPNPVELLASKRFSQLIRDLEQKFDRVILDGPPMQGFADTLVLSRNVGGVVLLSSMGQTTREALRYFKKSITNVNSTILGCIINKVDLKKRTGYQRYYRYYGHYGYGKEGTEAKLLESS